ncbi:type II secretion system F family protein [Flexivirga alba]|uniref:Type II secretion system F family protein n=1 Tax=Flexivirga alba TaxID=702742 RepID=A0ABW2AB10_9MICO
MRPCSRAVLVAVLTALITLGWITPSRADTNPTVTIGDLKAAHGTYQGVLTFRAKQVMQVDAKSVTATVDGKPVPITVQGTSHLQRTALLVIDTSGSMGSNGMQTVRQATAVYLKEVPSDVKVGVLRFASSPALVLQPTTNRSAVQKAVDGLTAGGNTALYGAVQKAAQVLGTAGDRSIVLLSDGADTESKRPARDLAAVTAALKSQGIRVDVVRFKNRDKGAERALALFAAAGGGSDVLANDTAGVAGAFRSSAQALSSQSQFTLRPALFLAGRHQLIIRATVAGRPFVVSQQATFGALPPSSAALSATARPEPTPSPASPAASTAAPSWALWGGGALLAIGVFLFTYILVTPSRHSQRERRIATIQSYLEAASRQGKKVQERGPSATREAFVAFGERVMSKRGSTARTMQLIQRADLPLRAGEWLVLRVLAVVLAAGAGVLLLGDAPLVGVLLGSVVGFALPTGFLRFKASRRAAAFEKQLPQLLTLVATSLRSGFGLPQALEGVTRDAAEPAAKELSRALAQVRIGSDIADALDEVSARMGTESLHMAVMAINIQRQVGGNLAETLDTTAHTLREREGLRGQVAALSAEGRLSAAILIALPICLFLYMMFVNYDYIALLWTTGIGVVMLIGTCVLMVIGIIWMRKTVQIEV